MNPQTNLLNRFNMISHSTPHHQQVLTNKFSYTKGILGAGYMAGPGIKTMTRGRGNRKQYQIT